jgi:Domain of unknown function (DUF1707)
LGAVDRTALRASDADRERAVDLLRGHAEVGRLTVEELDERCAKALAAKTFGELDGLIEDLPRISPPPQAVTPAPVSRPKLPGSTHFADTWRAPAGPEAAMRDLMQYVAPPLQRSGYELVERTPHRLVFQRSRRPIWTFVVAILVFPIGLLALLYKDEARIAIDLQPAGDETLVAASGVAPLAVRRAFAELEG